MRCNCVVWYIDMNVSEQLSVYRWCHVVRYTGTNDLDERDDRLDRSGSVDIA
jgi:hypothetical protein